ncbi:MAG TPA: hypothetical protein VFF73_37515 [Planctomycetota bacterium]|nr:hypothetical protein [Planctomycetota bacterium]
MKRTVLLLVLLVALAPAARAQDDPAEKAGLERFTAHVTGTRYHVGDRILVEDGGSGGRYSPRAEITAVLPGGRYRVKVWDKPRALDHPRIFAHPDALTGEVPATEALTRIVRNVGGELEPEMARTPWLLHDNEREITLDHETVDRLNGVVAPSGPYEVNGWKIDPKTDPVLADRIAKAEKALEEILPAAKRALPEDAAAAKAKLDEIAKAQVELLDRIFTENLIDHPMHLPESSERMRKLLASRPDLRGRIGAVLEAACGVCMDQAAAMAAIVNAISGKAGITARAASGPTIGQDEGHGFVLLRLANGAMAMFDVAWHVLGEKNAVDNLDMATFDERWHSNRRITSLDQPTSAKTAFVEPAKGAALASERGFARETATPGITGLVEERASESERDGER